MLEPLIWERPHLLEDPLVERWPKEEASVGEQGGRLRPLEEEQTWLADELVVRLLPGLWRLERWGSASLASQASALEDHLVGCLVAGQESAEPELVLAALEEVASRCGLVWLAAAPVALAPEAGLVAGQVLELG